MAAEGLMDDLRDVYLGFRGGKLHREPVFRRTGDLWQVKPYGFLHEITIRFITPVPNMDASRPIEFLLERISGDYEIDALVESVKDRSC